MKRATHFVSINALARKFLKLQLWVYAILLIGSLFGCAKPPVHLTPVLDRPNMDRIYFEGRKLALSFGEKSSVAVSGTIDGDELLLLILCKSFTERIDAIPEDISVLGYYKNTGPQDLSTLSKFLDYNGTNTVYLKIYPPAKYMAERHNAQKWSLALQALSGALDAQRAGKSTSTTYGSYGGKSFYEKNETKDREAVDRALAKHEEKLGQTAESYARSNAATESGLLSSEYNIPQPSRGRNGSC